MKIAMFPNPSASRYWRLEDPAKYLQKKGIDARVIEKGGITDEVACAVDMYVLNGCVDKPGIACLHAYQRERGKKLVVDVDDDITLNDDNPHLAEHQHYNYAEVVKVTMKIADKVTTTNNYLAKKLSEHNKEVVVLPNFVDLERWDLPKLTNDSETVRIGWAGSMTHYDDLKMIINPLKRICAEFPQVRLIFVGDQRIGKYFDTCPVEAMEGVDFNAWPARLHGLRLDIGLAPLRDTEFNRCKSPIKFYEYSIAKIAGVYSPTVYNFRGFDGTFGLIAKTEDEWYGAIKNLILNKSLREDIVHHAYAHVKGRKSLKKNIHQWIKAYNSLI